jgi:toxin-antitoxin system PIN domain toxin
VLAIDTNILLYALNADAPECVEARTYLDDRFTDPDVVVSELSLVELYVLLRNPAVVANPLGAGAASSVIRTFRTHPTWRLVDHDPAVMDEVWRRASARSFARSKIFDVRFALGLVRHGVTRLATRNVRDFSRLGFDEVFDPLR